MRSWRARLAAGELERMGTSMKTLVKLHRRVCVLTEHQDVTCVETASAGADADAVLAAVALSEQLEEDAVLASEGSEL